jgi:hypothetical protein
MFKISKESEWFALAYIPHRTIRRCKNGVKSRLWKAFEFGENLCHLALEIGFFGA